MRHHITYLLTFLSLSATEAHSRNCSAVVADSLSHSPLPYASVFNRKGAFIGAGSAAGSLPYVSPADYPITIRFMGFKEKTLISTACDTIFLHEIATELPEITVSTKKHKILHISAYIREYSTLSTYTDTVTLFREKTVDFMLPSETKSRYKGWKYPRTINSRSYYRFTNSSGLDSVSDRSNNHFTWSDWVGIPPASEIPEPLANSETATDTLYGLYSPTEIWIKSRERIKLDINVLADSLGRKWVPCVSSFFSNDNVEFEQFRMHLDYNSAFENRISPSTISGYSYNIESRGRGLGMFRFNRYDEPYFVTTYCEVYILDKEFINVKEAEKRERDGLNNKDSYIPVPADAPELQPYIQQLIARVESIDHTRTRLSFTPDRRLAGKEFKRRNFGQEALQRLKGLLGIDGLIGKRKQERNWKDFRRAQIEKNKGQ